MNDSLIGAALTLLIVSPLYVLLVMEQAQKYHARHKLRRAFRRYHGRKAGVR